MLPVALRKRRANTPLTVTFSRPALSDCVPLNLRLELTFIVIVSIPVTAVPAEPLHAAGMLWNSKRRTSVGRA